MPRSKYHAIRLAVLLFAIAACGGDHAVAPPALTTLSESGNPEYAAIQQEIAGLQSWLSMEGGLDQQRVEGIDQSLVAVRRQRMELRLRELQNRLATRAVPTSGTLASIFEEVPPGQAPGCVNLYTLQADGCIVDWTSTVNHMGTASVYQLAQSFWNHSTSTNLDDNSMSLGTRTTASFGMQATWAASFGFAVLDPNCANGDHTITAATVHSIKLGIAGYGVAIGEQSSLKQSSCTRRSLAVAVSPNVINIGQTANITVTNRDASCTLGVSSDDPAKASIVDGGGGYFLAIGIDSGTVTISALCGGRTGSTTLRVNRPQLCEPNCVPPGGSSPGDEPPTSGEENCHYERDVIIWSDGSVSWGSPWYRVCDGDAFTLRAEGSSSAVSAQTMRVQLVATSSLQSRRAVTVISGRDGAAASILIDTTRATAADVEQGIWAVQVMSGKMLSVPPNGIAGAFVTDATPRARQRNGPGSRAAGLLQRLLVAPESAARTLHGRTIRGRTIEAELALKNLRVSTP